MAEITVYEKPTCTTCKNLAVLLAEQGIAYGAVDYHVLGLTLDEVRDIVAKTGERPAALLRRRDPAYEELGVAAFEDDDERVMAAMVERPALLQRPVVIRGGRAVLARPVERALELF